MVVVTEGYGACVCKRGGSDGLCDSFFSFSFFLSLWQLVINAVWIGRNAINIYTNRRKYFSCRLGTEGNCFPATLTSKYIWVFQIIYVIYLIDEIVFLQSTVWQINKSSIYIFNHMTFLTSHGEFLQTGLKVNSILNKNVVSF